jgi:2-aminoadipate transaminase
VTAYDFATGNTNPETFPTDGFAEAAAGAIKAMAADINRYHGKYGHEGLRQLMADREFAREGVRIDPENIVLTNGSMQSITLVTEALCQGQGDVVVMEEYCYMGTINYFKSLGIEMAGVAMDAHGMRMDSLAETLQRLADEGCKPRFIYTLPTYQNPTGTMLPRERRLELVDLARRHDVVVVEDNCYGDVHFDGDKPPALYSLDDSPRQIYICSLSKIFAPGVRLGYVTAAPEMIERILAQRHDAGPNTLAAAITHAYLKDRLWDHIETANVGLKAKRDAMLGALETHLGNLCSISPPVGGLFIWVRLPDDLDPGHLLEVANRHDVNFAHGSTFHIHSDAGPYIRLAFGFPSVAEIETGIERLGIAVREARGSQPA